MGGYTDTIVSINMETEIKDKTKGIDITIGVFFDGTHNNKYNIAAQIAGVKVPPANKGYGSYYADYTNIVKLFDKYKIKPGEIGAVYIEGVETADRDESAPSNVKWEADTKGATGRGDYGINQKITRGCVEIVKKVSSLLRDKNVRSASKLTLDVFGFSRGAAVARSFISQIEKVVGTDTENYPVCLRRHISKARVEEIEIRFVGLFDTVSSFGKYHESFEDDVKELGLQIPPTAKKVVHLIAADEYRNYFAVTQIKSAGSRGLEFILPGCHSDIGGGYLQEEREPLIMVMEHQTTSPTAGGSYYSPALYRGFKTKKQLIEEGWAKPFNDKDNPVRTVSNAYSHIPLLLMAKIATDNKVPFEKELQKNAKIAPELTAIYHRICEENMRSLYLVGKGGRGFLPLKEADIQLVNSIRGRYIHLSAKKGIAHKPAKDHRRLVIDDSI